MYLDKRILPLYVVIRNIGASFLIYSIIGMAFIFSGVFPYNHFVLLTLEQKLIVLASGDVGVFLFVFFFTLLSILRGLYSLNSLTKYRLIDYGIKLFAGSVILTLASLAIMGGLLFYLGGIIYDLTTIISLSSLVLGFLLAISSQIALLLGIVKLGKDERNELLNRGPLISVLSIAGIITVIVFLLYFDFLYYSSSGSFLPPVEIHNIFMMVQYFLFISFLSLFFIGYGFLDLALEIKKIANLGVIDELIEFVKEKDYDALKEASKDKGIPLTLAIVLKKLSLQK